MENDVFDTRIRGYKDFGSVPVSTGEQVFLYRRLQDAYEKSLIAVINEMNDVIGYLDREAAAQHVLPKLKEGVRFQCVVAGEPDGDGVPLQIRPVAQSEVAGLLSRQGGRRDRTSALPPLAGLFDDGDADADLAEDGDFDEDMPDGMDYEEDSDDETDDETEDDSDEEE
jgi:hypothetical protein